MAEKNEPIEFDVRAAYAHWRDEAHELSDFGRKLLDNPEFADHAEDLGDWIEGIITVLSFGPDAGPDFPTYPWTIDPYGYRIQRIRLEIHKALDFKDEMSEGEYKNLIAIEEYIRERDNA